MIRVVPWNDVPQPVRRIGFVVVAAGALLVVVGLAVVLLGAAALQLAQRSGL